MYRPKALKTDVFDYLTVVWRLVFKEPREYPHKPYTLPETRVIAIHFPAYSWVLSLWLLSGW